MFLEGGAPQVPIRNHDFLLLTTCTIEFGGIFLYYSSSSVWHLTPPKFNSSHLKESSLPTTIFQGRAVKLRGCILLVFLNSSFLGLIDFPETDFPGVMLITGNRDKKKESTKLFFCSIHLSFMCLLSRRITVVHFNISALLLLFVTKNIYI